MTSPFVPFEGIGVLRTAMLQLAAFAGVWR